MAKGKATKEPTYGEAAARLEQILGKIEEAEVDIDELSGLVQEAAGLVDLSNLKEKTPTYDYEVQVFRIGDIAIVGLPGEPFVEGGLRIKLNSPTRPTFVAHDVNHYAGYLPIREAYERGGHETSPGNWSRFRPGTLEVVVETATDILGDMFRNEGADGEEKR